MKKGYGIYGTTSSRWMYIHIVRWPEREEKIGAETLYKNSSKFLIYEEKYGYPGVRNSSVPNQVQPKKISPNHIIATLSKIQIKERIVKGSKNKGIITYKESFIRLSANLSAETMHSKRESGWYTQGAKRKTATQEYHTQQIRERWKTFPDKHKSKEFNTTRFAL